MARRLAERERLLSPYATRSADSRGRERQERPHPYLSAYQLDRDRIIGTKAFRRLMHKTQVFISPAGDHYLTRLTHTLEVARMARTVSRALNLNEDLAEAICMGHDLGHAPFGHLGEATLAEVHPGGFRHNRQSVRVVEVLANDGRGLNLTAEVRQGILRHSKARSGIEGKASPELDTLEALVMKLSDALAYISHDTEDAIRAGYIAMDDVPAEARRLLGASVEAWVPNLVADMIEASWSASGDAPLEDGAPPAIQMSPTMSAAANAVRGFLFERVYDPASADDQAEQARDIIRFLYAYFADHTDQVPEGYSVLGEDRHQMALDYVSGMTDGYALQVAEAIRPKSTSGFRQRGVAPSLPPVR